MALSPLDARTGTGPLPALSVLTATAPAAAAPGILAALLGGPSGAGTAVLQGYDEDPFVLAPADDPDAAGETTGQLVMVWQPPAETDALTGSWDDLDKAKSQTAGAAQERVVLGATGSPVRVVGV
jgi:hypothetical protein